MGSTTGVRLTMKFNFGQEIRFAGFSESLDLGFNDLPTAIAALPSINALINDRLQCLGIGPILVEAVLSGYVQPLTPGAPPVRRNTVALVIPSAPPAGQAYNKVFGSGATPQYADFVTTDLYISLETSLSGTPVYRRNVWLSGLPDVGDITASQTIIDPATLAAVNKYIGDLNNSNSTLGGKCNVSIRSIDRSGANPVKACTAWNIGANTYTVPLHGFAPNQPILAVGMTTAPGGSCPRGRYLVGAVVDANTITLQGAAPPSVPEHTGGFRPAIAVFNAVAIAQQQGFTKRNHGRPFGLLVGRRRVAKIKRA